MQGIVKLMDLISEKINDHLIHIVFYFDGAGALLDANWQELFEFDTDFTLEENLFKYYEKLL